MAKVFERNSKESPITITKQIDINFRNYALYVLEHRGIPGFYDALTNVQRVILMNAPKTFNKTLSLSGTCISNGYHHGDASLQGAINKLARPFSCSEQLLLGDGFFGTTVTPEASAARYTSVRLNPVINEILGKNMVLNNKNDDDQWEWLRTEVPIGLLTVIMGIAVGYKTSVLPRKLEEIQNHLDGKKSNMNPFFKSFGGTVSSFDGSKKSWLISGTITVDEKAKSIRITEIPPLMKYESFIKKLSKYTENSKAEFNMLNDSSDIIDITLKYKGGVPWEEFRNRIEKMTKMIVTETMVFVKDGSVIEYEDLIDYLNEFKAHREFVRLEKSKYDAQVYDEELDFLRAKLMYLKFMLAKKRSEPEIDEFFATYSTKTKNRLERILLRDLSQESVNRVIVLIKEMEKKLIDEKKVSEKLTISHAKLVSSLPQRSKATRNRSVDLFLGEENEIDGIEVYVPEDEESEEENENE
jgi:DNA gyrase/topoisomerase IV subunit A